MPERSDLQTVPDDELLRRLSELLGQSRRVEADLVAHIAEVDARRLYAREAAPSMFAYCREQLHLSEAEAYLRIAVARASRRHPILLDMLADGRLHLIGIERLAPHLTEANRDGLLKRAAYRSRREIEELVAELAPRPAAPAAMRKLPERVTAAEPVAPARRVVGVAPSAQHQGGTGAEAPRQAATPAKELRPAGVATPSAPDRPASIEPVSPARYRVRFDASAALRDKLERLQALMRSSVPDGDLAKIIELAVSEKLERLEAKRFAKTKAPRKGLADTETTPRSRYIPAAVRRVVDQRDGHRCTYRDQNGRRCTERHHLEYHHREPFARGGPHTPKCLTLACRAHNTLLAEQDYGKERMARYRAAARAASQPRAPT